MVAGREEIGTARAAGANARTAGEMELREEMDMRAGLALQDARQAAGALVVAIVVCIVYWMNKIGQCAIFRRAAFVLWLATGLCGEDWPTIRRS